MRAEVKKCTYINTDYLSENSSWLAILYYCLSKNC